MRPRTTNIYDYELTNINDNGNEYTINSKET